MSTAVSRFQGRSTDSGGFEFSDSVVSTPSPLESPAALLPESLYFLSSAAANLDAMLGSRSKYDDHEELLESLERQHPEWFDEFASADADLNAMTELASLAGCAPHPFLAGLAAGKLSERVLIAAITGRRQTDFAGFRLATDLSSELTALERDFPEWFDMAARAEADMNLSVPELQILIRTAPHPYLAGAMYGRTATRIQIRTVTGR